MDETKVEVGSEAAELEDDGSLVLAEDGEGDDGADVMIESAEDGSDADGADGEADENGDTDGQDEGEASDEFDFEAELAKAFAEDEDENEESEEKSDEGNGEAADGDDGKKTDADADVVPEEPKKDEESPEARELRELREKYDRLERRSKDALKSLGMDETDAVAGLERLAREQSDMGEEEYKRDLERRDAEEDSKRKAEAERAITEREGIRARIEAKKKADLDAIHTAYPASAKYERLDDIPGFERFKVLRDAGATPEEAYAVVDPAGVNEPAVEALHKKMLSDSKSHLKSVGGRSAGSAVNIPRNEYRRIKAILGDDTSDSDIAKYYKKVKG